MTGSPTPPAARPDLNHAWRYVTTTPRASGLAAAPQTDCHRCRAQYAAIRDARRRGDTRAEEQHATELTTHWSAGHRAVQ
ncbi:hypothetical protein [Streptomyces luteireticuli]|uniref:hypothetical protein n=1 Tax=Streptomyces luteireticuli TaxID=173858 RepID=UPI0035564D1B